MKIHIDIKPISVNHAYSNNRYGRRFLTNEGKEYKATIAYEAKIACGEMITGEVEARYIFSFRDRRRRDVDDYIKLAQDSLVGIWLQDDSQIKRLVAEKRTGTADFLEIEINSEKSLAISKEGE